MKKAYKRPSYIADCDDQYQLKNAIDTMILDLLKNLETGYDLNINVVFEGVFNGIIITPAGKFDAILISDGYEINIGSINI